MMGSRFTRLGPAAAPCPSPWVLLHAPLPSVPHARRLRQSLRAPQARVPEPQLPSRQVEPARKHLADEPAPPSPRRDRTATAPITGIGELFLGAGPSSANWSVMGLLPVYDLQLAEPRPNCPVVRDSARSSDRREEVDDLLSDRRLLNFHQPAAAAVGDACFGDLFVGHSVFRIDVLRF